MDWGGLLGGIASGLFGYKGTQAQNVASAQQAEKAMAFSKASQLRQMRFQEQMSGSAHQRQMADMRKAGLNPILSAKYGGASSPAGSSAAGVAAPQYNKAQVALQNATTAQNLVNLQKQESLIGAQAQRENTAASKLAMEQALLFQQMPLASAQAAFWSNPVNRKKVTVDQWLSTIRMLIPFTRPN